MERNRAESKRGGGDSRSSARRTRRRAGSKTACGTRRGRSAGGRLGAGSGFSCGRASCGAGDAELRTRLLLSRLRGKPWKRACDEISRALSDAAGGLCTGVRLFTPNAGSECSGVFTCRTFGLGNWVPRHGRRGLAHFIMPTTTGAFSTASSIGLTSLSLYCGPTRERRSAKLIGKVAGCAQLPGAKRNHR